MKDVYSGRTVGYSVGSRMQFSLAVIALENAVRAHRPSGTVVHSDRGLSSGFSALSNWSGITASLSTATSNNHSKGLLSSSGG
ncbi:transposase family protein [Arthrobacter sp. H41]|uniref:transposase family protein n=1 Tax=Arthrobacter sp. H41 TaxID=1312978 RepID=UPI0004B30F49